MALKTLAYHAVYTLGKRSIYLLFHMLEMAGDTLTLHEYLERPNLGREPVRNPDPP